MTQRSILITGCSSGIGLATARLLKSHGWRVLATARRREDLERLEKLEGLEALPLELADEGSIAVCADLALMRTDGRLTALYNNAAYGVVGAMEDIPAKLLRHHLEVNVVGQHELTRRILPAMRRNGAGRIVNCSSVLGLVSGPYRGAYCASKFALEALTDALRIELRGSGIHVALIEPGPIDTQFLPSTLAMFRSSIDVAGSPHKAAYERRLAVMENGGPSRFRGTAETVALKVAHAVESSRPRSRYKVTLPTYGAAFLKRVLPTRLLDEIVARW